MTSKFKNFLRDGPENIVQSIYDNFLESNAALREKAGLKMTVTRESIGFCCEFCQGLIGTYDYNSRPSNIYSRHKNCTCVVTTKTKRGTYQDAWSRKEYDSQREARIAKEEELVQKNEKYRKNVKELTELYQKYGTAENLMLFATEQDAIRYQELIRMTGMDEKRIMSRIYQNVDNWESLLKDETDGQIKRLIDDLEKIATEEEKEALKMWTGTTYVNINRYLRYNVHVDDISRAKADTIVKLLNKIKTPEDIIVRRGTGTKTIFKSFGDRWKENPELLVGKQFTDKGLTATTPFKNGGFGGVGQNAAELFIKVPKGTHGAYISHLAHNDAEKEFLLQKGYSYKIIKAEYRNDNPWFKEDKNLKIWVEVILK